MNVKLDENLPTSIAADLRMRGIDAHTVHDEQLTGVSDPQLLRHAIEEDRMIFTLDRGFGDIRRYAAGSHPGIIVFRLDNESARSAREAILRLVDNHDLAGLRGTITVVQRGILRVRRPAT